MALNRFKKLFLASILSALVLQAASTPSNEYATSPLIERQTLPIVQTTSTFSHIIDWVPINSQGKIASPPAPLDLPRSNVSSAQPELEQPGAQRGPPGTVPIPRVDASTILPAKQLPVQKSPSSKFKRQYSGTHWYVSSNQNVNSIGGSASYSIFKAFVQNKADFSLLQTAVTHAGANGIQTLECGWINYPNQVSSPHLFTYYTTVGYKSQGNGVGGWNRDYTGWVQVDTVIFPGTVFSPNNVDGNTADQYELQIQYLLYQGNWWLWVRDRWIGYYPASLFSAHTSGVTLATGSDSIYYYGEILQTENSETTTDMGSGEFAEKGFGRSAYIHNMVYFDSNRGSHAYTAGFWDSDATRYDHRNAVSTGSWGSYVYLGGPGAGGKVGS